MWSKIKKALSVIADVISFGRAREWWKVRRDPFNRGK